MELVITDSLAVTAEVERCGVSHYDSLAVTAEVERCETAVRECHRREEETRQEISNKEAEKQRYLREVHAARSE